MSSNAIARPASLMRSHSSTVWLRIEHDTRVVNQLVAHLRERAERRLAHRRRWRGLTSSRSGPPAPSRCRGGAVGRRGLLRAPRSCPGCWSPNDRNQADGGDLRVVASLDPDSVLPSDERLRRQIAAMITLGPSMRIRGLAGQRPVAHCGSSLRATGDHWNRLRRCWNRTCRLTACEMALAASSNVGAVTLV